MRRLAACLLLITACLVTTTGQAPAPDGKQYVAVATGPSGEATSTLRLTPELRPSTTTQVVVFALP